MVRALSSWGMNFRRAWPPQQNKDTKAWQIFCLPCNTGRPEAKSEIFGADERPYFV